VRTTGRAPTLPARVGDWIEHIRAALGAAGLHFGHGAASASAEALWLVAHVLRRPFEEVEQRPQLRVSAAAGARLSALLAQRVEQRLPLAYLLGEAWLGPYRFDVDARTIVPRSFIAQWLLDRGRPWIRTPGRLRRALDLCTGSACLAILAALAFPRAQVDAVDLSADALMVARKNVRAYRLGARVRLLEGDLFAPVEGTRYDLIIANPPYVDGKGMRALAPEYRAEPAMALAGGTDGMDMIRTILTGSLAHLQERGLLVMEVGRNRARIDRTFPRLPLVWLDNPQGDSMVLLASAADLRAPGALPGGTAG
jgi:ribosomal protein L3 glutamine methyltransferase